MEMTSSDFQLGHFAKPFNVIFVEGFLCSGRRWDYKVREIIGERCTSMPTRDVY